MSLQPQRPRFLIWLTTIWAGFLAFAQKGGLILAQAGAWLRVQLAGWRRWGPGLWGSVQAIWAWLLSELPRWRTWAPRLGRWSQAKALATAAWYRMQTPARQALVVILLVTTILAGPTGTVFIRSDVGQRLLGISAPRRGPSYDPAQSRLHLPPSPPITGVPGPARPPMPHAFSALPKEVAANPTGFTFRSDDGRFEADVPAGAVTAQDLAGAAGHQVKLRVTQFAPPSGSTSGGSGLISFGSYLVELVDGNGKRVSHGFHKPVDIHLHYAPQERVFNLDQAFVVFNGAHPKTIAGLGATSSAPLTLDRVKQTLSTQIAIDSAFARAGTLESLGHATTTVLDAATTPSSANPWGLSFNSTSPVAKFVNPDPVNVDLSSGSLTTDIPLDLPAGPAGHTPPLRFTYNSGGVSEQHNPQGAAGWVGEGWNLSLGAITWSERDYNSHCTTCSQIWQNQWFLSDPFGTSTELLPPATNTSTYYDDTPNSYCATGNSAAQPCPIQFHTADESYAKVYAYVGGNNYGNANGLHTLCFRVYLPNGIMEEFGCSQDSVNYDSLQYYVSQGGCPGGCLSGYFFPSAYFPDLITFPTGDQIHLKYQSDWEQVPSGGWYPRDTVLSTVEWDSPDCINSSQSCTSSWHPHYRVQFNASHSAARVTNTPAYACNTAANVRCDDPVDLSGSSGISAPKVNSTFVLNDFAVQTNMSGNGSAYNGSAWNTVRDYQLGYEENGPHTIPDPVTGKQQSVAGYLDLTRVQQVGTDGNPANGSPLTTFGYGSQTQLYEDGTLTPPSTVGCGPTWNTGGNGNPCDLWDQSYDSNSRYLTDVDNHLGQTQTLQWENARSNTHGVNAGGSNLDPLYCNDHLANYPCNEADDQQWSRIVVKQHDLSTLQVTQQGQGGAQTSTPITTTYHYTYQLASYSAHECADCGQGFYWGDENSNDYLDFYSPHFAGFNQTTVSKPYGSLESHHFYSSEGWGVYNASAVTCTVNVPPYTNCQNSPWWDLGNVGHGREYEADYYDTDGTTLLKKVTNQYQAVCPPPGGATNWNGKQASELGNQSNPVVGCDVQLQESTTALYDGASTDSSAAASTVNYSYDNYGRVTQTAAANNGGLTAQYYSDTTLSNLVCTRRDPNVNFTLGVGVWPVCGLASTNFSARWTGKVIPRYNETYTFYTLSDDGVRLWVNGQLLVDNWTNHGSTENSGTIALTAGQAADIKMEYYQGPGGAVAVLSWSSPSLSKQVIPASVLQASATASGSPQSITQTTTYIQNDGLALPASQLNNNVQEGAWGGTYLVDPAAASETFDSSGNKVGCSYTSYDGAGYVTGQQGSLTHGNPTRQDRYTACATSGGQLSAKVSYDAYGNQVTTTDANNNTGCTANGVAATTCVAFGTVTLAQPTSAANTLNQTSATTYGTSAAGGFGLWPVSATDPNGQTATTSYDVLGRVSTMRLPGQTTGVPSTQMTYTVFPGCSGAQTVCYEVDAATRTDSATQVTQRRFYDGASRLVETRTPAPGGQDTVSYTLYDAAGRPYLTSTPYLVAAYTGAPGSAAYSIPDASVLNTQTAYDGLNRVIQTTDALRHATTVSYHAVCNAAGTNDSACYTQTLSVDANGHQHGALSDGLGRTIYAQDYTGNSGSTYALYRTTKTTYDALGRAVAILQPDGTHSTTFTYDTAGRLTAMSDPDRGHESYSYDANGNVTQTVDARGAAGTIYAGYDALNRQLWRNSANSAAGAPIAYTYDQVSAVNDGVGRLTSETFTNAGATGTQPPLSGSYIYNYDARGQVTATGETLGGGVGACPSGWTCADIGSPAIAGDQSALGNDSWLIHGSGADIWGTSDQFHYVYQTQAGDGSLSAQVTNLQTTDPWAKAGVMLRSSADPGAPFYAVEVTPNNGVSVQYRASQGASAVQYAGVSSSTPMTPIYVQLTRTGTTMSAATSSDGRTWTAISGSSISLSALGGSVLAGVALTSHNTNVRAGAQVANIATSTGGNAPQPSGVTPYSTSATYSDAGQLLTQTYPNGDVLTYSYDSASGWENQLSVQQSGQPSAVSLIGGETYTGPAGAIGLLTGATLGAFASGGGAYSASYDALGRLTSGQYTYTPTGGAATTLYEVQPSYDAVGNVTGVTTTLPQGTDTQAFCYDEQNRLTWAGATGTPPCGASLTPGTLTAAQYSASYSYDTLDRLTASPLGAYTYGDTAHLHAATAVGATWAATYDASGNTKCRAATSATTCAGTTPNGALLSWDNEGRLTGWQNAPGSAPTSSASYLYDGEGHRVQQVATTSSVTTTTSYIGSLEEVTTSGGVTTTTAYYGGALSVNGVLSYTLSDGLGSVSESVNTSTGAVSATQLYGPYGAVRYQNGTLPTNKGFTGQRSDASTSGLDYYGARYYDPVAGQFTSADTTLAGGLNRYGYVGGNPETWTDPSGHHAQACDTALCEGGTSGGAGEDPVVVQEVHPNTADTHPPQSAANNPDDPFYGMDGEFANTPIDANNGIEAEGSNHLEQVQNHETHEQNDGSPSHETHEQNDGSPSHAGDVVNVSLDGNRYPETAQHIQEAIDRGQPDELTIDRSSAQSNRRASLQGYTSKSGADRDEYPLAMTQEGGTGADIKYINPSDNRGAGSTIGHQLQGYPDGTRFRINILWDDLLTGE